MPIVDNFTNNEKKFNPLKNRLNTYIFCLILITGYTMDVFFAKLPVIVVYFNILNILVSFVLIIYLFFDRITINNVVRFQILGLMGNLLLSSFFNSVTAPDFDSMFVRNVIIIFMLVPFYGLYCGKNHVFQICIGFILLYILILIRSDNHFLINNAPFLIFSALIYHLAIYYIFDIIEKLQFKQIELSEDLQLQKENLLLQNINLEQKNVQINSQSNELTQLINTKDKLFSIIAHDLRSPVAGILGVTDILQQNFEDYEKEEILVLVGQLNTSSKKTLNLLENLLVWTNFQSGKIEFNPESFNINSVINEIIEVLYSLAKTKNIIINFNSLRELVIVADKNMIHTIVRNLVSNAIKFTNVNGEININVFQNDIYTEFSISDNGVGIKDEFKSGLFEINSKTTALGTKGEKGSGLGLVICKEFVEKHNGKIWFDTKIGEGTDFKFSIPNSIS